jgi:acyl-coenzyme A synthetase/AMP-(fatty) acid ligase
LQDRVKAMIDLYVDPRSIVFIDKPPKMETCKIQRFCLKDGAA